MKVLLMHVPPLQVQPLPTVHITLAYEEAEVLKCLVGGIGVNTHRPGPVDRMMAGLFTKLDEAGVGKGSSKSYSDFFKGDISTK